MNHFLFTFHVPKVKIFKLEQFLILWLSMIKTNLDCVCLHFILIMIDEALIDECMSMSPTFYCPDRNSQSPGSYFSLLAMPKFLHWFFPLAKRIINILWKINDFILFTYLLFCLSSSLYLILNQILLQEWDFWHCLSMRALWREESLNHWPPREVPSYPII